MIVQHYATPAVSSPNEPTSWSPDQTVAHNLDNTLWQLTRASLMGCSDPLEAMQERASIEQLMSKPRYGNVIHHRLED